MSSDIVIQVDNVSKQYRLGEVSTGSLHHDINRWWHRVRGKEDPYLSVTGENIRTRRREVKAETLKSKISEISELQHSSLSEFSSDYVWALRDINFEVREGEVLGIIGRNGAGKSTLLKILSRVTAPTLGEIRVKGRIASLLEVGTGFHQDLTGRENIYLNGAVLGMTKQEIRGKLDEIVDFSGCAAYLDTPVKRYSSGMVVRLGFAVAAHLDPEILIVDEVLAVGDAEFQKKCIGKMQDVASHGRTVLFVSHNMGSVLKLCTRAVTLMDGCLYDQGPVDRVISNYLADMAHLTDRLHLRDLTDREGDQAVRFVGVSFERESVPAVAESGAPLDLVFTVEAQHSCSEVDLGFSIHDATDRICSVLYSSYQSQRFAFQAGETRRILFHLDRCVLAPGTYFLRGRIVREGGGVADQPLVPLASFRVESGDFYGTGQAGFRGKSVFLMDGSWSMR